MVILVITPFSTAVQLQGPQLTWRNPHLFRKVQYLKEGAEPKNNVVDVTYSCMYYVQYIIHTCLSAATLLTSQKANANICLCAYMPLWIPSFLSYSIQRNTHTLIHCKVAFFSGWIRLNPNVSLRTPSVYIMIYCFLFMFGSERMCSCQKTAWFQRIFPCFTDYIIIMLHCTTSIWRILRGQIIPLNNNGHGQKR